MGCGELMNFSLLTTKSVSRVRLQILARLEPFGTELGNGGCGATREVTVFAAMFSAAQAYPTSAKTGQMWGTAASGRSMLRLAAYRLSLTSLGFHVRVGDVAGGDLHG